MAIIDFFTRKKVLNTKEKKEEVENEIKKVCDSFLENIKKLAPNYTCEVCGGEDFSADRDRICPLKLYDFKEPIHKEFPVWRMMCSKCKNIKFFSCKEETLKLYSLRDDDK